MVPWNSAKAKVQLRLGVQRLRTLQERKGAQAKASRRDIALLLEKGKLETARIKVENIINEDVYVELLEIMELYCELLIARFGLLDQNTREPDPGVSEGVHAIIHAAPRTELKELHILRDLLMHKFGREFSLAVMENRDGCVSERVTKKLNVATPPPELVDAYLKEIAKGYSIDWSPLRSDANSDNEGIKVDQSDSGINENKSVSLPVDGDTILAEARSSGTRTPKLPDLPPIEDDDASQTADAKATSKPPPPPKMQEDDFEALARRFEALKKR